MLSTSPTIDAAYSFDVKIPSTLTYNSPVTTSKMSNFVRQSLWNSGMSATTEYIYY